MRAKLGFSRTQVVLLCFLIGSVHLVACGESVKSGSADDVIPEEQDEESEESLQRSVAPEPVDEGAGGGETAESSESEERLPEEPREEEESERSDIDASDADLEDREDEEALEDGDRSEGDAIGLIELSQSDMEGFFLFGLSAQTGTPLTQLGNTVAGVIAQVVKLEATGDELRIRVVDTNTKEVVGGEQGIIESYPASWTEEGTFIVSFEKPIVSLEIQLYQDCTYGLTSYSMLQDPVWEGGMLTWGALESYASSMCWRGGVEDSLGMNIHFLRRFGANSDYIPKLKEDVPFGFFETTSLSGQKTVITRLPGATLGNESGQVTYYITADFPKKFRSAVKGVFQDWNDVFEDEVGIRPFVVEEGPATMIPWDPRYRTIAWDSQQTLGAVAPFIDDPTTGEMFSTYVLFWLADFQSMVESYEDFQENNPEVPWTDFETSDSAFGLPHEWLDDDLLDMRVLRRRTFPMRRLLMGEINAYRSRLSQPLEGDELENFIIADFLSHELGHNLGLRHNFLGSADHENHTDGPSSSVMDYILGMGMPGAYDRQAIRYAYGDGKWNGSFLYCTDENIQFDPGCMPYDVGNPVSYLLRVMDRMSEEVPQDASNQSVAELAGASEWSNYFLRLRSIMNSTYESLGPDEEPVLALDEWMERVACEEPCETHPWLRSQWALYMLYTQHFIEQAGWQAFPTYTAEQEETLLSFMSDLVLDGTQPFLLRAEVANKLPTANLPGAPALVDELKTYFEEKDSLSQEESDLLDYLSQ